MEKRCHEERKLKMGTQVRSSKLSSSRKMNTEQEAKFLFFSMALKSNREE